MKAYSRLIIAAAAMALGLGTASAQSSTTNDFFNENGEIPTNLPTAYDMKDLTPIEFVNPRADDIYWQKVVYRVIDLRMEFSAIEQIDPIDIPDTSDSILYRFRLFSHTGNVDMY